MTISSAVNRVDYVGTGSVSAYDFTFKVFSSSDLLVTKRDTSNVETTLVLNTDYTVSLNSDGTGTVTLTAGNLTSGYALTIRRVRNLTQTTDIRNQGTFYPESHENAFDHQVMLAQQQQDEIDRSVKIPESISSSAFDPTLPATATASGGRAIKVNDAGNGLDFGPSATEVAQYVAAINTAPPYYNILDYGSGTRTKATIDAAITALGTSSNYVLMVKSGTWTIDDDLTIPANIQLYFEYGAVLQVATTKTLTINGPKPIAPLAQIFSISGSGAVSLGYMVDFAWGEWFGMVSYDTDNTYAVQNYTALTQAIASHETVKIGIGTYRIQGQIAGSSGHDVQGVSDYSTKLKFVATANNQNLFNLSSLTAFNIKNMTLSATAHGYSGDTGINQTSCTACHVQNVRYEVLTNNFVTDDHDNNYHFSPEVFFTKWGAMHERPALQYRNATDVYVKGLDEVAMCGFRFHGKYKKVFGRKFSMASASEYASLSSDLEYESASLTTQWYALFACADDNDANATLKIVPFLQVKSVSGSVCTLNDGGELERLLATETYNWSNDALNGADCLVITETVDSRPNSFSGRVTTISDSTNQTVTLATIGNIDKYDWILPAPKSKTNYVYLGSFYRDSAEVRNFADGNKIVSSDSITLQNAHSADADAIATSQSFSAGGAQNFSLDGVSTKSGAWTGESGHLISFTTDANDSARTATITGTVEGTGADTEAVTLGNTTTVWSTKRFSAITQIQIDDDSAGNVTVGLNGQDAVTGQLPTSNPGVPVLLSGIISPLATGVRLQVGRAVSSATTGNDSVNLCHDGSNHVVSSNQVGKEATASYNEIPVNEILTFSFFQMLYIYSSGNLNISANTRKLHINGWYEP